MPRAAPAKPAPFPSHPGAPGRALLKDRAYADLKVLIQSGEFPPNTFLSERQLVARLGMSKTPIRSALEHLEAQGLVVVSPQQGIVVTDLSVREITDLFDVRSAIEPFVAARLAERHVGADGIARLDENLLLQANAASAGDALAATSLDVAFHALLAELLDNREVLTWLARCFDKLHRSILRINRLAPDRLHRSHQDHVAIAESICGNQAAAAAQRMTDHLAYGRQFLLGGGAPVTG
jgi:DNA-binding GntR family transcriptional regulator